jgi:hypothetical protein
MRSRKQPHRQVHLEENNNNNSNNQIIKKVLFLHLPILFCLFILTDHETNSNYSGTNDNDNTITNSPDNPSVNPRHLAIFTALSRHPPSMRIYRGIFELILLGFCASFSLYVYESVVDRRIIAKLLFERPYTLQEKKNVYGDNNNDDGCDDGCNDGCNDGYELTNVKCHVEDNDDESDEESSDESCDDNALEMEMEMENATTILQQEERNNYMSNNNSNDDNCNDYEDVQMPSPQFILNKSLDSLLLTLISLFFFTISSSAGGQYIDQTNKKIKNEDPDIDIDGNQTTPPSIILSQISLIAAPIFPLFLFLLFTTQLFFPWTKSKYYFWTCIGYTFGAPFYDISFRDGFIGDIFTSMVRPMQDIAYTSFYLLSGLQGWWTYRNDHDVNNPTTLEEDVILHPVEHSWLLHTIVLPACLVSPLWWRYCQTLRQCYDTKTRWPYLGNSFKYFLAAQVVIFGVFFDPKKQNHFSAWLLLYVIATIYQIFWDVFMDWELLVFTGNQDFLTMIRNRTMPLSIPPMELRQNRLYSSKTLYISIFVLNIILRFGWILNFIPMTYLSQTTGVLEYTFSADFSTFISPLLACTEIIRRTMWGFIRFELEAIKTMEKDRHNHIDDVADDILADNVINSDNDKNSIDNHVKDGMDMNMDAGMDMDMDMKPMSIATTVNNQKHMLSFKSLSSIRFRNDLSTASDVQIVWELCVYATIFTSMGIIAAVHRQVL